MEDIYCSVYGGRIKVMGGTVTHVIKAGLREQEFGLEDLERGDVSVWKLVGRAELMVVTRDAARDADERPEG